MSFFAGHSKKTAWKAFAHHQKLLGDRDLDGTTVKSVEKIICRVMLLMQRAVIKHVQRCFLGAGTLRHFLQQVMQHVGISLGRTFKLMTLAPVPESYTEMITLGCKSGCSTNRCSCHNVRLPCTGACKCRSTGDLNCTNDVDEPVIANQEQ